MADIVVAGAGICGSAAAMLLAKDGHSVTVLDRDRGPLPADVDEAWTSWNRRGVSQFRMAHLLLARGSSILRHDLPDVATRLEQVGGLRFNQIDAFLERRGTDGREPEDDRFDMLTGRRSTIEWVLATALEADPSVSVRRGVAVDGLIAGSPVVSGAPHVAGVRLEGGEEMPADLVIDATGRNSPNMRWLAELGGTRQPIEVSEDSGFAYYGRFFRSADGSVPDLSAPILTPIGTMSVLTIPSDNGTWSVTLYSSSKDKPLRRFRDPSVFESVVRECPLHAHWLDGEPISEMASMMGVADRSRSFVVDGEPVVTGLLSIAYAAVCSNPSIGRGMSLGLMHTVLMRDVVREHLDEPRELARNFSRRTASEIEPWHEETRRIDRDRMDEMQALADGHRARPTPEQKIGAALTTAAAVDLTVTRALAEVQGCLTTAGEVLGREGLLEHVIETAATTTRPMFGPYRARLLEIVG